MEIFVVIALLVVGMAMIGTDERRQVIYLPMPFEETRRDGLGCLPILMIAILLVVVFGSLGQF